MRNFLKKSSLYFSFISCLFVLSAMTHFNDASAQSHIDQLLRDIEKIGTFTWNLQSEYDPYQNGTLLRKSSASNNFLKLSADGTFVQVDEGHEKTGFWRINRNHQTMTLTWKTINGEDIESGRLVHHWAITSYEQQRLVLQWQGRHGPVEEVYTPINNIDKKRLELSAN